MQPKEKNINVRTLGGWLIPVQILIILNALIWLKNLQTFYALLGEKDNLIKAQNSINASLYNTFIYFELASSILFTFLSFAIFYYFFKRNKFFPLMMTIYLFLELVIDTASYFIFMPITGQQDIVWQQLIFRAVVAVLVIIYLRVSLRVKMTFIH
jgi:hypothetical protein